MPTAENIFSMGRCGKDRHSSQKKTFRFRKACCGYCIWTSGPIDGQIKQFDKLLMELYRTREESCARQLLPLLDELGRTPYLLPAAPPGLAGAAQGSPGRRNYENILDLLPHKEITHIPSNIHAIQNQVLGLIQKALDIDGRKGSLEQKLADYYAQGESAIR